MEIGVGVLIQTVRRDALWGASKPGTEGTDSKVIATYTSKYHAFAHGLGRHGSAFRDLACMPRKSRRKTAQDGKCRVQSGIAAASSKDEIGASFQRALQWLDAHHADNPRYVQWPLINMWGGIERADAVREADF